MSSIAIYTTRLQTFSSVVVGSVGGAWIVFLTACLLGSLSLQTIVVASAIMVALASERWPSAIRHTKHILTRWKEHRTDFYLSVGLCVALSFIFWPLYATRMIPEVNGMIMSGGSCYGDLPIHMYLAESFLIGCNKNISWSGMTSPIFTGERLTYPFLPDFHAAIFRPLGDTLHEGFLFPSFMMCTAMWGMLYCFTVRVTGSRIGGIFSALLTIGAGGMGGWRWIQSAGWNGAMYRDVIQHDPTGEWKYLWFAFVPHIMLPQRGACFAYPMAVLCLLLMWSGTDTTSGKVTPSERRHLLIYSALCAGSLPMVQAHSFIGVGVIIAIVAAFDFYKWLADPTLMVDWLLAGIVAVATGGPQMILFRKTAFEGYYGKFLSYGWLYKNYEFGKPDGVIGWFRMWWYSLGPTVHIFVALMVAYIVEAYVGWRIGSRAAKKDASGAIAYILSQHSSSGAGGLTSASAAAAKRESPRDVGAWEEGGALSSNAYDSSIPSKLPGVKGPTATLLGSIIGHYYAKSVLPILTKLGRAVGADRLEASLAFANVLSVNGRAFDTIKLAIGALTVFVISNYVNFQPWERDNAKIFYIFIFVSSALNGAALAIPFEWLIGSGPGAARIPQVTGVPLPDVVKFVRAGEAAAAAVSPSGGKRSVVPPSVAAAAKAVDSAIPKGLRKLGAERALFSLSALLSPALLVLATLSGWMMVLQEKRHFDPMFDHDAIRTGDWIKEHTNPKSVFVHNNYHIEPCGSLAGRPTLVAYYGWVSNHGYNTHERLKVRNIA